MVVQAIGTNPLLIKVWGGCGGIKSLTDLWTGSIQWSSCLTLVQQRFIFTLIEVTDGWSLN